MQNTDITGIWKGSYFLADLVVHVRQQQDVISGHAEIHQPFYGVDIYHFTGTVNGNQIRAAHFKGSSFEGKVLSRNAVAGVVTTVKGTKLRITAKRVSLTPKLR